MTSKLVLVRIVREAGVEGEGTQASSSTGGLKKGARSRIKVVLLLQLRGVTRALSCRDLLTNLAEKSEQDRHTFCPDRDGFGDKLYLNTRDASGLDEGED